MLYMYLHVIIISVRKLNWAASPILDFRQALRSTSRRIIILRAGVLCPVKMQNVSFENKHRRPPAVSTSVLCGHFHFRFDHHRRPCV